MAYVISPIIRPISNNAVVILVLQTPRERRVEVDSNFNLYNIDLYFHTIPHDVSAASWLNFVFVPKVRLSRFNGIG